LSERPKRAEATLSERHNQLMGTTRHLVAIAAIVTLVVAVVGSSPSTAAASRNAPLELVEPGAMIAAPNGALFIYDSSLHEVLERSPAGTLTRVAGNGLAGESGDHGPATSAEIEPVAALAIGPDGTLYLSGGGLVRAVSPSGEITTVIGGGTGTGPIADGTSARRAALGKAEGVAVSPSGQLCVSAPSYSQVLCLRDGRLYQLVDGKSFLGVDPLAPEDTAPQPGPIAFDRAGNLYLGGSLPYVVFVRTPLGRLHAIGALRWEPGDALAAGPPGSVLDAGNLELVRFSASVHFSGAQDDGQELFDYLDVRGLVHHGAEIGPDGPGGVAVLPDGTAILDAVALLGDIPANAPNRCEAVLVEIPTSGKARVLDAWPRRGSLHSC
jgi:hypothetical protein